MSRTLGQLRWTVVAGTIVRTALGVFTVIAVLTAVYCLYLGEYRNVGEGLALSLLAALGAFGVPKRFTVRRASREPSAESRRR